MKIIKKNVQIFLDESKRFNFRFKKEINRKKIKLKANPVTEIVTKSNDGKNERKILSVSSNLNFISIGWVKTNLSEKKTFVKSTPYFWSMKPFGLSYI